MKAFLKIPLSTLLMFVALAAVGLAWFANARSNSKPLFLHIFSAKPYSSSQLAGESPALVLSTRIFEGEGFDIRFGRRQHHLAGQFSTYSKTEQLMSLNGSFGNSSFTSSGNLIVLDLPETFDGGDHWIILSKSEALGGIERRIRNRYEETAE